MINSLWISKTGMEAQQMQLDVISNNLANVSTNGFKKSRAVFEDLMYQNLRQVGANATEQATLPTGLQLGLGVRTVATSRDFTGGTPQAAPGSYNVAINGNGFFQVTMPDGTIGYTRDGAFQRDKDGRLVTAGGLALTDAITIPADAESITINESGAVQAKLAGVVELKTLGSINLANFSNPAGLEPKGHNLYAESASSGQPNVGKPMENGLGGLMHGYLEGSNVNVVQELVSMIQTQRAYEMNSKAIQTSDQMLQKLGQL